MGLLDRSLESKPSMIGCIPTHQTFEGRLREEKETLESRLNNINKALELLEKNPNMAEMLEALQKLNY